MASVENLPPRVLQMHMKELREMVEKPMEEIRVHPPGDDVTEVQAVITGPTGTPFAGGEFHVKLVLGPEYPNSPPKGWFLTKIFHPNVSATGEICVSSLKKDWKPDLGVRHALMAVRCLLICPFAESALNEEAGKLLLESYDEYVKHATMFTQLYAKPRPGGAAGAAAAAAASTAATGRAPDGTAEADGAGSPAGKKAAGAVKVDKAQKEKKRALKRL